MKAYSVSRLSLKTIGVIVVLLIAFSQFGGGVSKVAADALNPPVITEIDPVSILMSKNGSPGAFALTLHATGAAGEALTWSVSSPASHGAATASGTGNSQIVGYTPDIDTAGTDSFAVQVDDGNGGTDAITVNVIIAAPPTLTAIDPAAGLNDLDTPVTITGSGFMVDLTNPTITVQPTAYLGSTALSNVTWVDANTLTASVPWGMDPGVYPLTVVNPDGGSGSLAGAFLVKAGIAQWNGGDLFGGDGRQILMKPGDPNTIYAEIDGAGLFRSRDAGENWNFIVLNGGYGVDPLHPSWLYTCALNGLFRSQDEGDTWKKMLSTWPDGQKFDRRMKVYASPYNPLALFVSAANQPGSPPAGAAGLIKSSNSGATWRIISDLKGIPVQDVAFHPTDPLQMVLGTQDGKVYQSNDGGDTWNEVTKPPVSFVRSITYNPYRPSEVWVTFGGDRGVYKSTDAVFTGWQNVTPNESTDLLFVKFTNADSVYTVRNQSSDGGLTWQAYGPATSSAYGEITFNPDDTQIAYVGDDTYGVQKTTDGGLTWQVKNQGLTGMRTFQIEISRADPLRIYATFGHWRGIYLSNDGANTWKYLPIDGSINVRVVREDPFDHQRIFVTADSGFYVSIDAGQTWSNPVGWNTPSPGFNGSPVSFQADPDNPGHLLVGTMIGSDDFHLHDTGFLYASSDYGTTWQIIDVTPNLAFVTDITFHPVTVGLVYLSTGGTGIYRSTDSGSTWEQIDDRSPGMQNAYLFALATHPRQIFFSGGDLPYRSLNDGVSWKSLGHSPGGVADYMFLNGDSTRLYAASFWGLFLSTDAGDSWTRAAGTLGQLNTTALNYAAGDNYTILYAATTGTGIALGSTGVSSAAGSNPVSAGIYRYVQHKNVPSLPGVPSLVAPASNALTADVTPKLDWKDAPNANHYQIQVATDHAFTTRIIDRSDVVASEFTPASDLTANTKYYWRVKAYNSIGKASNWSAVRAFRTALPVPVSLNEDGAVQNLRPKLTWDMPVYPLPAATGYTVQVSKNDAFSLIVHTGAATSMSYTPGVDLPRNLTLYWRVRANGLNGPSAWSGYATYTTGNPPSLPTLVAPANNFLTTDYRPTFDWSNSSVSLGTPAFDHYVLQVDDLADFSSHVINQTVSGPAANSFYIPTTDLAANTKYYWRVQACNAATQCSAWSAVRTLRGAMQQPSTIEPGSVPPDEANQVPMRRPTFSWNPVSGASGYVLEVSTTSTFGVKAMNATLTNVITYTPTADLAANTVYFWRLKATGPNGPSVYSWIRTFKTGNPPSTPTPVAPAANALVPTYTPLLDWSNSSVPVSTTFAHYQVQVATDAAFSYLIVDDMSLTVITSSQLTIPAMNPNSLYYWRVRAVNTVDSEWNFSGWSAVRTFRTKLSQPVIGPIGPAGSVKPVFDWEDVSGAAGYTIQISRYATFGILLVNATIPTATSTYTPSVNLPAHSTLYWRVRANGANGPSDWMTTATFTTP